MSGFEVAGIILGVVPLAIQAAKGYMTILSSMKDAKRNLKALIHDLETEQVRLEMTCEVLLDGIVTAFRDRPHDPDPHWPRVGAIQRPAQVAAVVDVQEIRAAGRRDAECSCGTADQALHGV